MTSVVWHLCSLAGGRARFSHASFGSWMLLRRAVVGAVQTQDYVRE